MSSSEGKGSQDLVHADSGATDSSEKVINAREWRPQKPMFDGKLRRGTLVIMNDCDCPEDKMVAVLSRFDDRKGIWYAQYLSPHTNMSECWTSGGLGGPTAIEDFGMRVEIREDEYRVVRFTSVCKAQYRDGLRREWQCLHPPHWRTMRKKAAAVISAHSAGQVTFCDEDVSAGVSVKQPKPSLLSPSETEDTP